MVKQLTSRDDKAGKSFEIATCTDRKYSLGTIYVANVKEDRCPAHGEAMGEGEGEGYLV